MKIMVISDLHGSATACEQALACFKAEKADRLLILGDILYHGPRNPLPQGHNPQQVANLLNAVKSKILCVRGNCDADVDQCLLEFGIFADYALLEVGGLTIFATHGHKLETDYKSASEECDVVVSGHTHITVLEKTNGKVSLNPGSISLPKENTKPSYAIIESSKSLIKTTNRITVKSLDGEVFKSITL